jgi:hypothetical protein
MRFFERRGVERKKTDLKPAEDIDRLMIDKVQAFESRPDMQELLDFRLEILKIGIHGVRAADLEYEDMSAWNEFRTKGFISKESYDKLILAVKPGPAYVSKVNFSQYLKHKTLKFIQEEKNKHLNTPQNVNLGDVELK